MPFLSSALAGIPATTLPSFLAASIVLSHSVCPLVLISSALGAPRGMPAEHVTRKIKTWIRFNLPPISSAAKDLDKLVVDLVIASAAIDNVGEKNLPAANQLWRVWFNLGMSWNSTGAPENHLPFLRQHKVDDQFSGIG